VLQDKYGGFTDARVQEDCEWGCRGRGFSV
jgi:hypothetical protein